MSFDFTTEQEDKTITPSYELMKNDPKLWLAFGFGSGLSKYAPGTVGTLVGLIITMLLIHISVVFSFLVLILAVFIAPTICTYATEKLNTHDSPAIVIDEMLAIGWVVFFLPTRAVCWLVLALVLFRIFDIIKPPPIGWIDKNISTGWGIMLDDYVAAAYTIFIVMSLHILFV